MNNKLQFISTLVYCCLISTLFFSCDDAEQFKERLDSLPQISNTDTYKYKSAYGIGDTLSITGFLYPEKNLKITVGGVEAVLLDTVENITIESSVDDEYTLNRVKFRITKEMGVGSDRPVLVTAAGNTVQGASIEIYDIGGEGSFSSPLGFQELIKFNTNRRQNIYLHCVNGKGTVYYFDYVDKNLKRLKKGNTEPEVILTASQLKTDQSGTFTLSKFLAGGVNPQETKAWLSIQTSASTQVSFCEIDLETKTLKRLNISTNIAAPYTGNIDKVNMKASGIFPDSKGNVYLWIGSALNAPQNGSAACNALAVAKYDSQTQQLSYIFKTTYNDMPGISLQSTVSSSVGIPYTLYISPDEDLLYVFYQGSIALEGYVAEITKQAVVNLNSRAVILTFTPLNTDDDYTSYLGPFRLVKLAHYAYSFTNSQNYMPMAETNFGFMPLPSMRSLFLLYQEEANTSTFPQVTFPKWLVSDFKEHRVYQYHIGRFNKGNYSLSSSVLLPDQLLNYDEEGHLYMTASERQYLVKTKKSEL